MAEVRGTMRCPFCGDKTSVLDSRSDARHNNVRRRRQCNRSSCNVRFTTVEIATIIPQSANDLLEWVRS